MVTFRRLRYVRALQHQLHWETLRYDFLPAVVSVASVGVWERRQEGDSPLPHLTCPPHWHPTFLHSYTETAPSSHSKDARGTHKEISVKSQESCTYKTENPYNYKLRVSIFSPGCDTIWHLTASSGILLDPLPNFQTRAWHPREFQRKHKSDKRNAAGLVLCMCVSVTPTKTNESAWVSTSPEEHRLSRERDLSLCLVFLKRAVSEVQDEPHQVESLRPLGYRQLFAGPQMP